MSEKITSRDLIPPNYRKYLPGLRDICTLGLPNLEACLKMWTKSRDKLTGEARRLRSMLALVKKSPSEIKKVASRFKCPSFPEISMSSDWPYVPVPTDETSSRRKHGSTTLRVCGWCKYVRQDLGLWGIPVSITGTCPLVPDWLSDHTNDYDYASAKVSFYTPCLVAATTDEKLLSAYKKRLEYKVSHVISERDWAQKRIDLLRRAIKRAEKLESLREAPIFPFFRSSDWASVGSKVAYLVGRNVSWPVTVPYGTIVTGTVTDVDDYRLTVTLDAELFVDSVNPNELYIGRFSSRIMLQEEQKHLDAHPEYKSFWVEVAVAKEGSSTEVANLLEKW